MLHPSYVDLMEVVNKNVEEGETPVINSRYSIVMATAKRARQIIDGDEPLVKVSRGEKPLSTAVAELNQSEIRILAEGEPEEEYEDPVLAEMMAAEAAALDGGAAADADDTDDAAGAAGEEAGDSPVGRSMAASGADDVPAGEESLLGGEDIVGELVPQGTRVSEEARIEEEQAPEEARIEEVQVSEQAATEEPVPGEAVMEQAPGEETLAQGGRTPISAGEENAEEGYPAGEAAEAHA